VEFPRASPSGVPQTSLGFRGHLITNFQNIMVLLISNRMGPSKIKVYDNFAQVFKFHKLPESQFKATREICETLKTQVKLNLHFTRNLM
jgi:hypothetical protein